MPLIKSKKSSPLICKVEYVFTDDVDTAEKVGVHQVNITLKPGKSFSDLYGTPASHNFSVSAEPTRAGIIHKQKLSLYYPGIESAAQPELLALEGRPVITKITYQNEASMILGSLVEPAKAFIAFNSSDATGNSITITCDSTERARFMV